MPLKSIVALCSIAVCLAAIIFFALISRAALPDHPWIRGSNDLVLHALAFGVLTFPTCVLLGVRRSSIVIWGLIILVEAAQILIPGRQASIEDILSGGGGWLLAIAIYLTIRKAL